MKILISLLLLLLAFGFSYGQTPLNEQKQVQVVFDSFHNSLEELTKRFKKNSPRGIKAEITQSLDSITDNVDFLKKVMMTPEKPILKEYLEGVALNAEVLKELAAQKSTTAPQLRSLNLGLKEVASDLTLKITGPRAGGDVVRLVEVFVRAKKGTEDVGGYQVIYVSRFRLKNKTYHKPFDRLTDPSRPSSMKLAPGNYVIWLMKGAQETKQQPASIGENNESQRTIEVPVP